MAKEAKATSGSLSEQENGDVQSISGGASVSHSISDRPVAQQQSSQGAAKCNLEPKSFSQGKSGPISQSLNTLGSQPIRRAAPGALAAPQLSFRRWDVIGNLDNAASEPYRLPKAAPLEAGGQSLAGLRRWVAYASADKRAKLESFDRKLGRPPNAVLEVPYNSHRRAPPVALV